MGKQKIKLEVGKKPKIKRPNVSAEERERRRQQLLSTEAFIANRQPGMESPNPSGVNQHTRPFGAKLLSEAAKAYLQDRAPIEVTSKMGLEATATWADVIALNQMLIASAGGVSAIEFVHNVTEGKVAENINHNGLQLPPPCTIVIRSKEKK